MAGVRIILAVLIALSLGLSPAIAATAPHEHAPATAVMAMADMEECDHASGGTASDDDCPDCRKNANCTPGCCVLKCFQRFVETPRSLRFIAVAGAAYLTANAEKPAEHQYTPQPPPPRS
jgi:hypothetical protein